MTEPVIDQTLLRQAASARLVLARPELNLRFDLEQADQLAAAYAEAADVEHPSPDSLAAVVVIRQFDLAPFVLGTCRFALDQDPDLAQAWRRDLTRTVFLAGNPDNLRSRFTIDQISDDALMAWLAPAPMTQTLTMRRLLTKFDARAAFPASNGSVLTVPAGRQPRPPWRGPAGHELLLATAGLPISQVLVPLNHLLVEAVLDGQIQPGDSLRLRTVPSLVGQRGPFTYLRAMPDQNDGQRLRAEACLLSSPPSHIIQRSEGT